MLDNYFFSALPDWIFSIKALLFTLILPASHTCVANQDKISTILGTIFNTFFVHQNILFGTGFIFAVHLYPHSIGLQSQYLHPHFRQLERLKF